MSGVSDGYGVRLNVVTVGPVWHVYARDPFVGASLCSVFVVDESDDGEYVAVLNRWGDRRRVPLGDLVSVRDALDLKSWEIDYGWGDR